MILNLKQYNEGVEYEHFKMENLHSATNLTRLKCYMASVDLSIHITLCLLILISENVRNLNGEVSNVLTHVCPMDWQTVPATSRSC